MLVRSIRASLLVLSERLVGVDQALMLAIGGARFAVSPRVLRCCCSFNAPHGQSTT